MINRSLVSALSFHMGNKVLYYSPTITFHCPWLYEWIKQNEIQFYFGLDLDPDPDFFLRFILCTYWIPWKSIQECSYRFENWAGARIQVHDQKVHQYILSCPNYVHEFMHITSQCTTHWLILVTNAQQQIQGWIGMTGMTVILDLSVCSFRSVGVKWLYLLDIDYVKEHNTDMSWHFFYNIYSVLHMVFSGLVIVRDDQMTHKTMFLMKVKWWWWRYEGDGFVISDSCCWFNLIWRWRGIFCVSSWVYNVNWLCCPSLISSSFSSFPSSWPKPCLTNTCRSTGSDETCQSSDLSVSRVNSWSIYPIEHSNKAYFTVRLGVLIHLTRHSKPE